MKLGLFGISAHCPRPMPHRTPQAAIGNADLSRTLTDIANLEKSSAYKCVRRAAQAFRRVLDSQLLGGNTAGPSDPHVHFPAVGLVRRGGQNSQHRGPSDNSLVRTRLRNDLSIRRTCFVFAQTSVGRFSCALGCSALGCWRPLGYLLQLRPLLLDSLPGNSRIARRAADAEGQADTSTVTRNAVSWCCAGRPPGER